MSRTAVVILNWNTKDYLEKFLPGVIFSCKDKADVIVADSASTDGSMTLMSEKFPQIRTVPLDANYGFTGGYNKALSLLQEDGYDYYVLLNSDIEVPQGWIDPLLQWMDSHPECGACGPKLHSWYNKENFEYAGAAGGMLDKYGYPFCRGRILGKVETDTGQYDTPADVLWVTGACLMIRSKIYHELGGLDNRFFAHMEEIDLCWRMQLKGWKVTVVPESTVWHLGGGTLPQNSPWKLYLNFRNNLLMLENNLARTFALKTDARKACRKAKCLLTTRMILDGMSAMVYLLTFKFSYFKSVIKAHNDFRKLRTRPSIEEIETYRNAFAGKVTVKGLFDKWIILQSLIKRDKVFDITH